MTTVRKLRESKRNIRIFHAIQKEDTKGDREILPNWRKGLYLYTIKVSLY